MSNRRHVLMRSKPRPGGQGRLIQVEGLESRCLLSGISINEFPTSIAPFGITPGPDGNLWFGEFNGPVASDIAEINPTTHAISQYPLPNGDSLPNNLTTGPDGNIWFTDFTQSEIGVINTTTHAISEFHTALGTTDPRDITSGPDGNLWFTESPSTDPQVPTGIGVINPITDAISEFMIPVPAHNPNDTAEVTPQGITLGPDGNLWFVAVDFIDFGSSQPTDIGLIGKINPTTRAITEYQVPTTGANLVSITLGPDGNLWFTDEQNSKIGEINPYTNAISEYTIPSANADPSGITTGPDGNLWFTEGSTTNQIGEINPTTHVFTEYPIPSSGSNAETITTGPDNKIWFVEEGTSKVAQVVNVNSVPTTTQLTADSGPVTTGQSVSFTAVAVPQSGNTTPTGNVTFTIDGQPEPPVALTVVDGKDEAVFTTSSLGPGSHKVSARYTGDSNSTGSTSNIVTQVVNGEPLPIGTTTTLILDNPSPTVVGVGILATVGVSSGAGPQSGSVDFVDQATGQDLGTEPITNGSATIVITGLSPGSHNIIGTFSGASGFAGSTSSLAVNVEKDSTFVSLNASTTSAVAGAAVTLSAQAIAIPPANDPIPSATIQSLGQVHSEAAPVNIITALSGSITFMNGLTVLAVVPIGTDGQASFTTKALPVGLNHLIAVYSGDNNYQSSTSSAVAVGVTGSADGPRVVLVQRYGFHALPTTLVVTFNEPLDPTSAQNPLNYLIVGPLSGSKRHDRVTEAVYDPSTSTVTLHLSQRLNLHLRYSLTIHGSKPGGVADIAGRLLDGLGNGQPGSDYSTTIDAANLVVTNLKTKGATEALKYAERQKQIDASHQPKPAKTKVAARK